MHASSVQSYEKNLRYTNKTCISRKIIVPLDGQF